MACAVVQERPCGRLSANGIGAEPKTSILFLALSLYKGTRAYIHAYIHTDAHLHALELSGILWNV